MNNAVVGAVKETESREGKGKELEVVRKEKRMNGAVEIEDMQ